MHRVILNLFDSLLCSDRSLPLQFFIAGTPLLAGILLCSPSLDKILGLLIFFLSILPESPVRYLIRVPVMKFQTSPCAERISPFFLQNSIPQFMLNPNFSCRTPIFFRNLLLRGIWALVFSSISSTLSTLSSKLRINFSSMAARKVPSGTTLCGNTSSGRKTFLMVSPSLKPEASVQAANMLPFCSDGIVTNTLSGTSPAGKPHAVIKYGFHVARSKFAILNSSGSLLLISTRPIF